MPSNPNIITFLIADSVIQEKGTNKWSAIGIFDHVYASRFPTLHNNMALYIRLSDAEGEYDIRVEFVDSDNRRLGLFEGLKLRVASKLEFPDFGIRTQNLMIPKPGKYNFDLYFNNELCKSCPLFAEERNK